MTCPECGYEGIRVLRCLPGNVLPDDSRCTIAAGEHLHLACMRCGWKGLGHAAAGELLLDDYANGAGVPQNSGIAVAAAGDGEARDAD